MDKFIAEWKAMNPWRKAAEVFECVITVAFAVGIIMLVLQ